MKIIYLIYISIILLSCKHNLKLESKTYDIDTEISYILKLPKNPKGLIIIFPKFNENIIKTDNETEIDEKYYNEGFASLIVNYNHDFFLNEHDFNKIYLLVDHIIKQNKIPSDKIIIGGFSVGGNIALSYSIWIKKLNLINNVPISIFVGDSPIDLEALYYDKIKIIKNKFNKRSLSEANFIINYLNKKLGSPILDKKKYYNFSPFISSNYSMSNFKYLKNYNIIFFSEPDIEWYRKTIGYEYDDLNAFQIEKIVKQLKKNTSKEVIYIQTKNKGYINGRRHPHSWTIIDKVKLFNWTNEIFKQ